MQQKQLVILPLFNEAGTVGAVLKELRGYYGGDILVVQDGSTDESEAQVRALRLERLQIVSHSKNLGYGQALITGFQFAMDHKYDSVVTMDCDLQHEPKKVPEFFSALKGWDVVSGSRYFFGFQEGCRNGNGCVPEDRFRINRLVTERINAVTDFGISDAFCGFKAYAVRALSRISLDEPGYAMPLQFWVQAALAGLRIKEVPVARIYVNLNRSFGANLDDPERRLAYYYSVIDREVAGGNRCNVHRCASR